VHDVPSAWNPMISKAGRPNGACSSCMAAVPPPALGPTFARLLRAGWKNPHPQRPGIQNGQTGGNDGYGRRWSKARGSEETEQSDSILRSPIRCCKAGPEHPHLIRRTIRSSAQQHLYNIFIAAPLLTKSILSRGPDCRARFLTVWMIM
jgi:hypothetical protein